MMLRQMIEQPGLRHNSNQFQHIFGPRGGRGGGRGGRVRHTDINERVNRMNPQEFENYMNELHLRDSKKPLKKDVLEQLPRTKFVAAKIEESKNENTDSKHCSVCMCDYEDGEEILTLDCFHSFHTPCIEEWFKNQNWCPICKHKIGGDDDDQGQD